MVFARIGLEDPKWRCAMCLAKLADQYYHQLQSVTFHLGELIKSNRAFDKTMEFTEKAMKEEKKKL